MPICTSTTRPSTRTNRRAASTPTRLRWRSKAARVTERSGRPGEAAQHYRQIAEQNPKDGANWLALARASFLDQITVAQSERNWHEFREAFKKAADTKANGVALYMLEADYSAAEGKLDQAVTVLNQAPGEGASGMGIVAGPGRDAGAAEGRRGSQTGPRRPGEIGRQP